MKLPPKNTPIPLEEVLKLCDDYGLVDAKERILKNPPPKPFVFDGASGCPAWLSRLINEAALPHDIEYWVGGTEKERLIADAEFMIRVVTLCNRSVREAEVAFNAVRIGGQDWLPTEWRWGFGWE